MQHKAATVAILLVTLQLSLANNLREPPKRCSSEEVLCSASNSCMPEDWICDGSSDCESGEDETNCMAMGRPRCEYENDFMCGDGECIPEEWVCDTDFDCPDHTDERNCAYTANPNADDSDVVEAHAHRIS